MRNGTRLVAIAALCWIGFAGALAHLVGAEGRDAEYIPADLDDCHRSLDRIFTAKDKEFISAHPEKDMIEFHFSVGLWLRNNWGLRKGSRLSKWFNDRGLFHPDDMSGVILDSYWCKAHRKPFSLEERVSFYQRYWGAHDAMALAKIRRDYQAVRKALPQMRATKKTIEDMSTEGAQICAYREGGKIRFLTLEVCFESGKEIEEYLLDKGELVFALKRDIVYNVPISGSGGERPGDATWDPKKFKVSDARFYFKSGRLIHWLKGKRSVENVGDKAARAAVYELKSRMRERLGLLGRGRSQG